MFNGSPIPPHRAVFVLALLVVLSTSCVSWKVVIDGEINQKLVDVVVEGVAFEMKLEPTAPIPVEILHRNDIDANFFLDSGREDDPRNPDHARAAIAMGLRSTRENAVEQALAIRGRVLRGLYRSTDRTVYYVPEPPISLSGVEYADPWAAAAGEFVLAHEVVHAIQHQHYPEYFDRDALWSEQFDAYQALHAALEGVADYYATRSMWYLGDPMDPDERERQRVRLSPLDEEHPLVRASVQFAYDYGYRLAYRHGMALMTDPPASTEQVMNSKETFSREPFDAISLAGLETSFRESGCRKLHEDTLGKFGMSIWLQDLGVANPHADAPGWNGDRWIAFDCHGRVVTAWLTSWDYQAAAVDFARRVDRASQMLRLRRHIASDWTVTRRGLDVLAASYHKHFEPETVFAAARRGRVQTREQLRAHFEASPPE